MPLLPEVVSDIKCHELEKSVFYEAKIEKNPVTLDQVERIIPHSRDNFSQDTSAVEVINIAEAHRYIDKNIDTELAPEIISAIHKELTTGLPNIKEKDGAYRNGGPKADIEYISIDYTPPASTIDINFLVKNLIEWINNDLKDTNPIIKAILLHLHVKKIQPYSNANGHTARLLELWYLKKHGIKHLPYMLCEIYESNRDEYYDCVSEFYKSSDVAPFISFVCNKLEETVYSLRDKNYAAIEKMLNGNVLESLYKDKALIKRQFDFLSMVKDEKLSFKQEDLQLKKQFTKLYGKVSRTTVSRDIKKFEEMNLIRLTDDGYVYNENN
jgi:Fic family protein